MSNNAQESTIIIDALLIANSRSLKLSYFMQLADTAVFSI